METQSEILKNMYQALGKLFYAIAASDKTVRNEETEELKKIVKSKWLDFEDSEDEFGTDSAYQIEVVFDWLLEVEPGANDCFDEFRVFKEDHEALFTLKLKHLIYDTASAIASAFANKNKSELVMLSKLAIVLEGKK